MVLRARFSAESTFWSLEGMAPKREQREMWVYAVRLQKVERAQYGNQSPHHQVANPYCGPWAYGAWTSAGARDGALRIPRVDCDSLYVIRAQ